SAAGPTTPVLDNFNRANGPVGANWTVIKSGSFASMNVSGSAAVNANSAQFAWNYWNAASFGPDVEAYVTVTSYGSSDVIRIGARVIVGTSYSGYFVAIAANGTWSILRIDNASVTTLATGIVDPLTSGDQIAIRIVGSVITALHGTSTGWRQILSYDTSHDTTRYTTAGRLALEFRYSTLDGFGGGTLGQQPANTATPTITGQTTVGQTLTATTGTWTGNPTPTYSFQGKRCDTTGNNCTPITGATQANYTLTSADAGTTLIVTVTATNTAGTANANPAATTLVTQPASAPANTAPPTITGQTPVGQTLTATTGTWTGNPTPTYSYQWKRCDTTGSNCTPISGATQPSYTLTSADAGSTVTVTVTATNTAGQANTDSAATALVAQPATAPANTAPPTITGQANVGQTLTATTGTWTGDP